MLRRVLDWLDDRSGYRILLDHILYEPLPAQVGFKNSLGSVCLFLIGLQILTGILLLLNYSPSPDHAYNSISYIMESVWFGWLIRGIHFWAASLLIVCIGLHLLRVFIYGAYKPPRELTWIFGVVLLLLVFGMAFTGYLLPWHQRSYWATVVGIEIAGKAPLLGPWIATILRGGAEVGALTLTRFFTLHVIVIPALLIGAVGIHILLMRRNGPVVSFREEENRDRSTTFYPMQVFRDSVVIFVVFCILIALVVFAGVPEEPRADPTDQSYLPKPEWYFLFLYQLLKYFTGPFEIVGTIILPTALVLGLLLLPFYDRRQVRNIALRPVALVAMLAGITGYGLLTYLGYEADHQAGATGTVPDLIPSLEGITRDYYTPIELAGLQLFQDLDCRQCHRLEGKGGTTGPALPKAGSIRDAEWIIDHFRSPGDVVPGSPMPGVVLTEREETAMAAYMLKLQTPGVFDITLNDNQIRGGFFFFMNKCQTCHTLYDEGVPLGPALDSVGSKHDSTWFISYFKNPQEFIPGTMMPPVKLANEDLKLLTSFILQLTSSHNCLYIINNIPAVIRNHITDQGHP